MNRALLALVLISALVSGARGEHCTPLDNTNEIDQTTPAGQFYLDNDLCQTAEFDPCTVSLWIYQETNGYPGLQRSDLLTDNSCGEEIPADTIILGIYGARPA